VLESESILFDHQESKPDAYHKSFVSVIFYKWLICLPICSSSVSTYHPCFIFFSTNIICFITLLKYVPSWLAHLLRKVQVENTGFDQIVVDKLLCSSQFLWALESFFTLVIIPQMSQTDFVIFVFECQYLGFQLQTTHWFSLSSCWSWPCRSHNLGMN